MLLSSQRLSQFLSVGAMLSCLFIAASQPQQRSAALGIASVMISILLLSQSKASWVRVSKSILYLAGVAFFAWALLTNQGFSGALGSAFCVFSLREFLIENAELQTSDGTS